MYVPSFVLSCPSVFLIFIPLLKKSSGEPVSFVEKPKFPQSDLAAAGLYLFSHRVVGTIAEMQRHAGIPYDLGFHVFPKLISQAAIYILNKPIIDIGTPEAYESLCKSITADK